jgi:hypothetical protein
MIKASILSPIKVLLITVTPSLSCGDIPGKHNYKAEWMGTSANCIVARRSNILDFNRKILSWPSNVKSLSLINN